jgi:YD repeat-containing protein
MTKHRHSFYHHLGVSSAACASDLLWRTTLDATGRRTARHDADGARLAWGYDPFDQLTSAARTNSPNGAADAAYRYGWQYDLAGNHLHESRGQMGLEGNFNNLNQLTARDWSGKLDVWGSVEAGGIPWEVLVNGAASQQYNGTNYLGGAELTAGSNAIAIVYQDATVTNATSQAVFAPPTKPQAFQWDANGNLLNDGYRAYTWDGENRLTAIEMAAEAVSDGLPAQRSEFVYDGQGRRLFRTDLLDWNGTAYAVTNPYIA